MINIIRLKSISFYAYHGVFRQEQNIGGKFEADVEIFTDYREAAAHDTLHDTIDYEKVYKTITEVSDGKKYYLIEALAMSITDTLFSRFANIDRIILRVRKNNPPIGGILDSVEVEIDKTKAEYNTSSARSGS